MCWLETDAEGGVGAHLGGTRGKTRQRIVGGRTGAEGIGVAHKPNWRWGGGGEFE
jgi:hypothetical protein